MTISENLEFSVVSAPVAAFDRRALSQAWYSALYGSRAPGSIPPDVRALLPANPEAARPSKPDNSGAPCKPAPSDAGRPLARAIGPAAEPIERRGPQSTLARKIERAFLRPQRAAGKASFTLESDLGRVQVVLQSRGSRCKLVAVCSAKASALVAQALLQARYALAKRGIQLDAQARESAA